MNSKLKMAAAIAAVMMVGTVQVYAENYLQQLKSNTAAAQTAAVDKINLPEIVIIPADAESVNETAETVVETAKPVRVITEAVTEATKSPVYYDIPLNREQQDIIREISEEYGVPVELALAVMQVESGFDVDVIGNGNCYGIMQIHKINHSALEKQLGVTDWLSLSDNARAGCYMLGKLLDKYQDETRALMAYNMGEGAAKKAWNTGTQSTGYTQKVQSAKQSLTEQANENAAG